MGLLETTGGALFDLCRTKRDLAKAYHEKDVIWLGREEERFGDTGAEAIWRRLESEEAFGRLYETHGKICETAEEQ